MMPIRKKQIKQVALNCFLFTKPQELPIDVKSLVQHYHNCRFIPYSEYINQHGVTYEQIINYTESEDACSVYLYSQNKYIILYNDINSKIVMSNRYRWNIIHELGHVLLGHHKISGLDKLYRQGFSESEYKMLEAEADQFAAYILVPHAVLNHLDITNQSQLSYHCQISFSAAKYRFDDYKKWKFNKHNDNSLDSYDQQLECLFSSFIHKKTCANCLYVFSIPNAHYCPICGHDKLLIRRLDSLTIYKGYDVDKNGKVKMCPICKNEETSLGDFCPICGTNLVNRCTGRTTIVNPHEDYIIPCEQIQQGNARYCVKCGAETTFFQNGLLKDWNEDNSDPNFFGENDNTTTEIFFDDNDLPF